MTDPQNPCQFNFDTSYSKLPKIFFTPLKPTQSIAPQVVLFNQALANDLSLDFSGLSDLEQARWLSGTTLVAESAPLAQAYAGHQFGHFTVLGDGRAHLLGEHLTPAGYRFDIQLKGSGQTPYSRCGDGKAALGPMLREYIISEAMHHLGIATTRSLGVTTTGETVARDTDQPGAVLTRVAQSHLRVGTVEFANHQSDPQAASALLDYIIQRHYAELTDHPNRALALLATVQSKQIDLVVNWMRVGFIHGVMNTDNMALSGETIDYGPCAFMDEYDPSTVFSSIDHKGRYAYGNQPNAVLWNLARLAESLLPLIDTCRDRAIQQAEQILKQFSSHYQQQWTAMMRAKLGLLGDHSDDAALITDLLQCMQRHQMDYTNTFRDLAQERLTEHPGYAQHDFKTWHQRWYARLKHNKQPIATARQLMQKTNPVVIPRNHMVEQALRAAQRNHFSAVNELLEALRSPYQEHAAQRPYQEPPKPSERVYQTFCGT
jgi:uncharacterized protein YdiU (UPF0061 family)